MRYFDKTRSLKKFLSQVKTSEKKAHALMIAFDTSDNTKRKKKTMQLALLKIPTLILPFVLV